MLTDKELLENAVNMANKKNELIQKRVNSIIKNHIASGKHKQLEAGYIFWLSGHMMAQLEREQNEHAD